MTRLIKKTLTCFDISFWNHLFLIHPKHDKKKTQIAEKIIQKMNWTPKKCWCSARNSINYHFKSIFRFLIPIFMHFRTRVPALPYFVMCKLCIDTSTGHIWPKNTTTCSRVQKTNWILKMITRVKINFKKIFFIRLNVDLYDYRSSLKFSHKTVFVSNKFVNNANKWFYHLNWK